MRSASRTAGILWALARLATPYAVPHAAVDRRSTSAAGRPGGWFAATVCSKTFQYRIAADWSRGWSAIATSGP